MWNSLKLKLWTPKTALTLSGFFMSKITIGHAMGGVGPKPEISWFSQAYKRELSRLFW
ncbi:exported hypothetical protein [Vibrio coralliirubri]|nr:exported hypothetical protein [Vibrio coralliirubri]